MQGQKFEKKGITLGNAFNAVLIVALVAILIVAVIYMFTAMQSIPQDIARTVNTETVVVTNAGTPVSNYTACGFSNFAVVAVTNGTASLNTANYTVGASGTIANASSVTPTGTSWIVNYTYTDKGSTCTAAATFTTNFSNQIPLIGLVLTIVLIAIVIGVLVTSFFMRRERV